jgi:hypothetical protein
MSYFVQDRFGNKIFRPTEMQMEQLLASLDWGGDPTHPEVSLIHQSGWSISVYPGGGVILKNTTSGNDPWHMRSKSSAQILQLWALLAAGELDQLGKAGWSPGAGAV